VDKEYSEYELSNIPNSARKEEVIDNSFRSGHRHPHLALNDPRIG
jgi:hypothetical protein